MRNIINKKVAIIGMGHMGNALQQGLLSNGFRKENLFLSNRSEDNRTVAEQADWVILTVKPSAVRAVVQDIGDLIIGKILISAAAGVSIAHIKTYTKNRKLKVIRIMPNIPIAYKQGVIGLYSKSVMKEKKEIRECFSVLGEVLEVTKEVDLESLTLIAGCGPAIVSYFISIMIKEGVAMGLSHKDAARAAMQTYRGTLTYLNQKGFTPEQLQKSVATKGGVTKEILQFLQYSGVQFLFAESLKKGKAKIDALKASL